MTIRRDALQWLASRYGVRGGSIYTSKFYEPEESWTKRPAWWLEIPLDRIQTASTDDIHLLCQTAPQASTFHYLKVPVKYFQEQLPKLSVLDNGKVSLFLSAEPKSLFIDQRGKIEVNFSRFLN